MSRMQALTDLRDKVAAGCAPKYSFMIEARVLSVWACLDAENRPNAYAAYNGSLSAAKALHEAVLPDWDWIITNQASHAGEADGPMASVQHIYYQDLDAVSNKCPARALLIADLNALIAQETTQ